MTRSGQQTTGGGVTPLHRYRPAGEPVVVASLADHASFVVTAGRRVSLTTDEVRRLEQELLRVLSSGEPRLSMRALAARVGLPRHRVRRAIGSVDAAITALVRERITAARSCVEMPTGWHPSLVELGERVVIHRLFLHRIVADVMPMVEVCPSVAADVDDLHRALRDDLRYQVRRWRVFDDQTLVDAFADEVGSLLSFGRLHALDDLPRAQLERRLMNELSTVFGRYGAFQRWNQRRHEWFEPMVGAARRDWPAPAAVSSGAAASGRVSAAAS